VATPLEFYDLGKPYVPSWFIPNPGSLGAEASAPRSDPEYPGHPADPLPLRLWGQPWEGWHLRRRGVSDASDATDQPDRSRVAT